MSDEKLDGEPDPTLLCPPDLEGAENHTDDDGAEVAVYEAQVGANGNKGFNGEDGFPLCCACGGERSEHVARTVDVTESVNRANHDRLVRLAADPSLTKDQLYYMTGAPQDTAWLRECKLIAEGEHPDPAAFADSVRRLTRIAWTHADRLESCDALGDEDENETTYDEYLWFYSSVEEQACEDVA